MASGSWQPFGYEGEDGTCLWCGRKLRYLRVTATDADKGNPTYRAEGAQFATIVAGKSGPNFDGLFDTTNCGYQFGRRFALNGHRLVARGRGGGNG